ASYGPTSGLHHPQIFVENLHGALKIQAGHRVMHRPFLVGGELISAVTQVVHPQLAIAVVFACLVTVAVLTVSAAASSPVATVEFRIMNA
ncbi:MAG: hypothetical protein FWH07_01365, partial [Oscillospiraceae bacterium]|nr:hypothetical protein [Oscillospiraceae bacterium]